MNQFKKQIQIKSLVVILLVCTMHPFLILLKRIYKSLLGHIQSDSPENTLDTIFHFDYTNTLNDCNVCILEMWKYQNSKSMLSLERKGIISQGHTLETKWVPRDSEKLKNRGYPSIFSSSSSWTNIFA